ncbi:NAD-dependent epimerase/dehydratase family protein [Rhodococcus opacus RKJ300 = JCM 13270]|uniref:NAD-dependent epimerase/dehydratase family protein n=1 Tax=Rhodococcus opacus RKJ300 = JCM 13270 TaxID=1165867 RepID=I0WSI0_RHOOP|nr:NAD-dependent epimerase/dehydratase family protein [Rhodococcus opacus]EID79346.1 NAD-dependent epimerase/dehydratase family protein [Rhodococcus opacus RKJ300 = JCM 13270]
MKVAVTGATSDFGAAILPVLLADPDIDTVVGLGRRELPIEHPKLESVRMDIRDPGIEEVFRGCEAVVHLAFVVEEIRDKTATHDINLRGSRNVIDSAYRAGVVRVVIASSINAYGPELRPEPVNEDVYPAGDPDRYYFHDKAEVEHYAEWWLRRHQGEMAISMLRPTYIIGPDFSNDGIDQLTGPVGAFPRADDAAYQFLHQRDMADAFHRAVKQDLVGPFNLGPRDWVGVRELAAMQGQRMFDVPERPAVVAANVAFRLGLTAFSGQWVTVGETVVDSTRLTEATGWAPTLTARESAAVMVLLQGKPVLRREDALERRIACEAALEPASEFVGVDGRGLEHVQIPAATGAVHAEVHAARSRGAATVESGGSATVESGGSATVESGGSATVESGGSATVESGGSATVESGGSATVESGGSATVESGGSATVESGGSATVESGGSATVESGGSATVESGGSATVESGGSATVESGGSATVESGGSATVESGGSATVESGGSATVESGGSATVESGGSATVESGGSATVESGGSATVESGGSATVESGGSATVESGGSATVVLPAPPGLHARYLTPFAAELAENGVDVVVVDLPGHGLSTGKRGRATVAGVNDALAVALGYARIRFGVTPLVVRVGDATERVSRPGRWRSKVARSRTHASVNPADGLLPRRLRYEGGLGHIPHAHSVRDVVALTRADRVDS